jgi:hypothetical protein
MRFIRQVFDNIMNFIVGILFTSGLTVVFLVTGVLGSFMSLFRGTEPVDSVFDKIKRGVVPA